MAQLPRPQGLALTLEKRLPVAAGLGGGSADAGAVFRIVEALHGLPDDWRERAAKLGADVPACVESRTCLGHGTGTELASSRQRSGRHPGPAGQSARAARHRAGVRRLGWAGSRAAARWAASRYRRWTGATISKPPLRWCPEIADVLAALAGDRRRLARMSGSGATCFALYSDVDAQLRSRAGTAPAATDHPDWWQMSGSLRSP